MSFLDQLPVSPDVVRKLESLGAETPEALLALSRAASDSFESFLGYETAQAIRESLRSMIPVSQIEALEALAPNFASGAQLGQAPELPKPPYDLKFRDHLAERIHTLRLDPSARGSKLLADLELQLSTLLQTGSSSSD